VTRNNAPTPLRVLARLNLDSQGISISNECSERHRYVEAA